MSTPRLSVDEPLLEEVTHRKDHCRQIVVAPVLLVGCCCFFILSWMLCVHRRFGRLLEDETLLGMVKPIAGHQPLQSARILQSTLKPTMSHTASSTQPNESGALSEFVTTTSGVLMPRLIYGTEWWKKDDAEMLVRTAARAGYQGLDTAAPCAKKREIGAALAVLFSSGVARDSMFIQTALTPKYAEALNPHESVTRQAQLSIKNALTNLGLKYVDSLVLHEPYPDHEKTMEVWGAMEDAVNQGFVRQLGIDAACGIEQLNQVFAKAKLKPAFVQQRLGTGPELWGRSDIRSWCVEKGIYFQSFWSPNADLFASIQGLAAKYGVTPEVVFFRFAMGLGVVPIIDPNPDQIKDDIVHMPMQLPLSAWRVPLSAQDAEAIGRALDQAQ
eukprot:gnl/TRDRNA2_/TRDRNA2_138143_c0_seq1.p1 gnl/TRDRNA2_/TRDRNA2_138143_c0~~gnl/TRDRNA2_/TRDRNA2_138143_c0_seq1.p1  ORF type:complete len:386 (+),score=40.06 gnl/TRDRNA2_/TRDRNA2_138143_c0_seq1:66-1223(+)